MAIQHWYNGIIVLDAVQLRDERGFAASAELGQVEVCSVMVEDAGGTRDYVGLKSWQIKETAASDPVIWNGFVTRQRIHRGESDRRFPTGAGRVWEIELTEGNGMLSRKVIRSGASRVSETVAVRLTWLLTTTGMTGVVVDHGLVESCSTVMDANDYTGQYAMDVLRDLALISGWNFLVRWRAASSDLELIFSDFDVSALDASTLQVSNVLSDVDQVTTWFPGGDATLVRDPTRIAAGVWLPYANGNAYGSNATTAATFADVDQVAPTPTVKDSGAATALVNRFLASHNVQDERLESVRLTVPRANVNDVKHGQIIPSARFSHLPGWTTARGARVLYKSVGLFSDSPDAYTVDLVLSPMAPLVASYARLTRGGNNNPVYDYRTNTPFILQYENNGDYPHAGDVLGPTPLAGPLAYTATSSPAGGPYTVPTNMGIGIQCLGAGILSSITLRQSAIEVITGTQTYVVEIRRNAIVVGSASVSVGPGAATPELSVTATNVTVNIGDVISGWISGTQPKWLAPAGVGADIFALVVTGNLRVRP
jgi:hypothetical protein